MAARFGHLTAAQAAELAVAAGVKHLFLVASVAALFRMGRGP